MSGLRVIVYSPPRHFVSGAIQLFYRQQIVEPPSTAANFVAATVSSGVAAISSQAGFTGVSATVGQGSLSAAIISAALQPGTSPFIGTTYTVFDANDNEIILSNGQSLVTQPLTPRLASLPTALLNISGTTIRLTQANAAGWPYSAGQSFTDADNNTVSFVAVAASYSGGMFTSVNSGGVRMRFKGFFCDLTAANLTALGTPLAAFATSGVIS